MLRYHALAATRRTLPPSQFGRAARSNPAKVARSYRALFVDFDGVLHPTLIEADIAADEIVVGTGLFGWLPALVSVLRPHADVAVVVHSTWRRTHDIDELRGVMGALGSRVVGMTPPGRRFDSIESWLRLNPQVSSYRILDDDPSEFPVPPPPELIVCDPRTGVAAPAVIAAIRRWLEE